MFSTLLWVVAIWTAASFLAGAVWVGLVYGYAALARLKRASMADARTWNPGRIAGASTSFNERSIGVR